MKICCILAVVIFLFTSRINFAEINELALEKLVITLTTAVENGDAEAVRGLHYLSNVADPMKTSILPAIDELMNYGVESIRFGVKSQDSIRFEQLGVSYDSNWNYW